MSKVFCKIKEVLCNVTLFIEQQIRVNLLSLFSVYVDLSAKDHKIPTKANVDIQLI